MGYTVNGQDLSIYAECQRSEDTRIASDFNDKYIEPGTIKHTSLAEGFEYNEPYEYFLYEGNAVLAKKGTRPNTNLRCEVSEAGLYYLTKFSDGEVWLLDQEIEYNNHTTIRSGYKIGDEKDDLQYVFIGLFGAGGGASGGNSAINVQGRGGASGGSVFALVKLVHESISEVCGINTLPIVCGQGGNGCRGNNVAQAGKLTGLYIREELPYIYASGGGGAYGQNRGVLVPSKTKDLHFVTVLTVISGANAGSNNNKGESVPITTTPQYAPIGENGSITFGGYVNSTGRWASAGGNGPLGSGGNSYGGNGDWGDSGQITGGGGGGNYRTFGTTGGGNGGNGVIRIYY